MSVKSSPVGGDSNLKHQIGGVDFSVETYEITSQKNDHLKVILLVRSLKLVELEEFPAQPLQNFFHIFSSSTFSPLVSANSHPRLQAANRASFKQWSVVVQIN